MSRSDEKWLEEYERLLRAREAAVRDAVSKLARVDKRLQVLDTKLKRHKGTKGQPTVLVRVSPGPTVEIFHSAERPCGRVGVRANFDEVMLGEAVRRGLRGCSACAWNLDLSKYQSSAA